MGNVLRVLLAVIFVLTISLAAFTACDCGGDDDDDSGGDDDSGDDDAGADDDAGDDDASGCGSADLLPGTWTAGEITMVIADDLTYHTTGSAQMNYDVNGVIVVDGCTASFTDTGGEGACPVAQVGVYDFVVTATTLTTTLVSDACAGRALGLNGTEFQRQ